MTYHTIECFHCGETMLRSPVVVAKYADVIFSDRIGRYAEPVSGSKIIHRHCFDDVTGRNPVYDPNQDELVAHPLFLVGAESSPRECACCSEKLELGDTVWSLTYCDLSVTPSRGVVIDEYAPWEEDAKYPDTYICSDCGDTFVYGE